MKVIRIDQAGVTPATEAKRQEPDLSLVAPKAPGERARGLLQQARTLSLEHLDALQSALAEARILAEGVVQGGDLYAPGLNDYAKRLSEELMWRSRTLEALAERQRDAARAA